MIMMITNNTMQTSNNSRVMKENKKVKRLRNSKKNQFTKNNLPNEEC